MTFKLLPPTYDDNKERKQLSSAANKDNQTIPRQEVTIPNYPNTNNACMCDHVKSRRLKNFLIIPIYVIIGVVLGLLYSSSIPLQEVYITHSSYSFEVYESEDNECKNLLRDKADYSPEQLHISLGRSNNNEIMFQWATLESVAQSSLFIRPATTDDQSDYEQERRIDGIPYSMVVSEDTPHGMKNRTLYGYYAVADDLVEPKYKYFIETSVMPTDNCDKLRFLSSNVYTFNNPWYKNHQLTSKSDPLRVAVLGDLGLINGQSTPRLIGDVDKDMYHLVIHNGDFGYDLNNHLGTLGDQFMRSIESIAARVPYQTSVGNHEIYQNFSHYSHRFLMTNSETGERNSFYYSFNMGPVHFVAYSTEFYYFLSYLGPKFMVDQWNWLVKDLTRANSPSERAKRPWIVVFGHRPMYCSGNVGDDCRKDFNILRKGLPILGTYNLEKLFYERSVDLVIEAHEHSYERFLPLFDGKVMNGTDRISDPYYNPKGPVHMITGSAGCQERIDPFDGKPINGSIVRISDYGYSRMFASSQELTLEQVSDDLDGHIVDKFTISKTRLRNFP